jgi:hypothetical protein
VRFDGILNSDISDDKMRNSIGLLHVISEILEGTKDTIHGVFLPF